MTNEKGEILNDKDFLDGELADQEPFAEIEEPSARLAGYNQIPDFGDDTKGTLQESVGRFGEEERHFQLIANSVLMDVFQHGFTQIKAR